MNRVIKYIGIAGFFICLIMMYTTDIGIPGLREYDADFRLLDMRFHYTADDVFGVFEMLGIDGIATYREFWILDFFFIACLLIVMLAASDKLAICGRGRNLLIILAIARTAFDSIENSILIYLSSIYPTENYTLAAICPWVTTLKFIVLIAFIICIIVVSVTNGKLIEKLNKKSQRLSV